MVDCRFEGAAESVALAGGPHFVIIENYSKASNSPRPRRRRSRRVKDEDEDEEEKEEKEKKGYSEM